MVDYVTVTFDERNLSLLANTKEREKFRQKCIDANALNKAIYQKANEKRSEVLDGVKTVWGNRSTVYNYVNRVHIDSPPDSLKTYERVMKAFFRWERAEEQRNKNRAARDRQKMTSSELKRKGLDAR